VNSVNQLQIISLANIQNLLLYFFISITIFPMYHSCNN